MDHAVKIIAVIPASIPAQNAQVAGSEKHPVMLLQWQAN